MPPKNSQPQYDFLTGGGESQDKQTFRDTLRASQAVKPDQANEELRAQVYKLQYEIDSLKTERELTTVRHDEALRVAQAKADGDYKRAQASESSSHAVQTRYDALVRELQESRDQAAEDKAGLEWKIRSLQEQEQTMQEEVEDAKSELSTQERQFQRDIDDLKAKYDASQRTTEELRVDLDDKSSSLLSTQQRLVQKESEVGELENEVMRLKTQAGDSDTLALIKRELSEQVEHIKQLETTNTDQRIELKQLRKNQKSVDVVEEEKRALENRLNIMGDLRKQLSDVELQKQVLEDEKKAWSSYLEGMSSDEEEDLNFETPEDLAKAYVQERLNRISMVEKLGKVTPELSAKDETIATLEEEKTTLQSELEKIRATSSTSEANAIPDAKARARLERQRALAIKEVEYLRAQLKAFDAEQSEFNSEQYNAAQAQRLQELEDLVDKYRTEAESVHEQLTAQETATTTTATAPTTPPKSPTRGTKRPRDSSTDSPSERLGEALRKIRTLQDDLTATTNARTLSEKELSVTKSQLSSLKKTSRTRVLQLRDNPTSAAEGLKLSTLTALRAENEALLKQLEDKNAASSNRSKSTVPSATLDRMRADLEAKDKALASAEKHAVRMKQIFASKTTEFREAVASILGWKFDFLPNGRVRVTSMFHPGNDDSDAAGGDEGVNSIVFDGEKGTMKVSGGPQSRFAGEIKGLIEFWVEGRKEVPCFLAAATLEFWEKKTGTTRV